MGKLILTMHTTADGFVATEAGEMWPAFGWPPEAQKALNEVYRGATAAIYGRGTYETVVPFWTNVAQNGIPEGVPLDEVDLTFAREHFAPLDKYVVSRGFEPKEPGIKVIRENVAERVAAIVGSSKGHVVLLAGGALAGELVSAGLVDEIFLLVGPVALGRGRPLLDVERPTPLRLLGVEALPPTCTLMRYAVESEFPTAR